MCNFTSPDIPDGLVERIGHESLASGLRAPFTLEFIAACPIYRLGFWYVCAGGSAAMADNKVYIYPPALEASVIAHEASDQIHFTTNYRARVKMAKVLAHEFKHLLDTGSIWCLYEVLTDKIMEFEQVESIPKQKWWQKLLGRFCSLVYYLDPLEIRARWYGFRHWKRFHYVLWGARPVPFAHIREMLESPEAFGYMAFGLLSKADYLREAGEPQTAETSPRH